MAPLISNDFEPTNDVVFRDQVEIAEQKTIANLFHRAMKHPFLIEFFVRQSVFLVISRTDAAPMALVADR
ncbi:hypothetical protein [Azospirillum canadense]|uniref:hypothetical protein n=1 Tax=Azospirillum canadense TaxID=403962 RepID=UPI002226EBFD|nr:hypothetical protein [Azospirillum canadense]MCW2240987.1 hypothetical protein [Azospirillum canadense]